MIATEDLAEAREADSRKVPIKDPNPKGKQILKETTAVTTFGVAKMPIPVSAVARAVADLAVTEGVADSASLGRSAKVALAAVIAVRADLVETAVAASASLGRSAKAALAAIAKAEYASLGKTENARKALLNRHPPPRRPLPYRLSLRASYSSDASLYARRFAPTAVLLRR